MPICLYQVYYLSRPHFPEISPDGVWAPVKMRLTGSIRRTTGDTHFDDTLTLHNSDTLDFSNIYAIGFLSGCVVNIKVVKIK
ncbi:hypothetical protein DF182_28860 [Chitinophaga flava]|uniref:Uncharacterized protein n=1 Tax=Chitinophaga flava TaxID=2259036 RepID=A0A365XVW7_9BACT|nr:hypothetical protein DF182_28860 [Chitinophaga flava]